MPALLDKAPPRHHRSTPATLRRTPHPTRRIAGSARTNRPVVPCLDAVFTRVLSRLPRWNTEALSRAGEYIAVALSAGQVDLTDPAVENHLLRLAALGFKAGEMYELRHRKRFRTGVLNAVGAPVVDSAVARNALASGDVPLSRESRRGRVSQAEMNYRLREARVLDLLTESGLSGAAAERAYDYLMADPTRTLDDTHFG